MDCRASVGEWLINEACTDVQHVQQAQPGWLKSVTSRNEKAPRPGIEPGSPACILTTILTRIGTLYYHPPYTQTERPTQHGTPSPFPLVHTLARRLQPAFRTDIRRSSRSGPAVCTNFHRAFLLPSRPRRAPFGMILPMLFVAVRRSEPGQRPHAPCGPFPTRQATSYNAGCW